MTAPVLSGTPVLSANGTTLTLIFTVASSPLIPSTGITGFVVHDNGVVAAQASAVVASSTHVVITLSSAIGKNHPVTVSYAPGNLTDTAAAALAAFTATTVTNNSTQVLADAAAALAIAAFIAQWTPAGYSTPNPAGAYSTHDGVNVFMLVPATVTQTLEFDTPTGTRLNTYDASNYLVSSTYAPHP